MKLMLITVAVLLVAALAAVSRAELVTDQLACRNFFTDRNGDKCAACCTSKGFDKDLSRANSADTCVCAREAAETPAAPEMPAPAAEMPAAEIPAAAEAPLS